MKLLDNERIDIKRIEEQLWLGEKGDPQGIMQETEIRPYWQMVYAQARRFPRKLDP